MEYANKIRFIVGTYVNLAPLTCHINERIKKKDLDEGDIDVKKKFTSEKGTRSKALTIYAVQSVKDEINEKLCNMNLARYECASYRNANAEERMVTMCHNDKKNIKVRCKTLFNAKLSNEVLEIKEEKHVPLEQLIMSVKINNDNLF